MGFCLVFTASDSDISCFRTGAVVLCDSFSNGFCFFIMISLKNGKAQREFGTLLISNFQKIKFSFNNSLFCTGKVLLPC